MKEPALSVVIPTYRRSETLKKTLKVLLARAGSVDDCEVIVVDDGSSNGTAGTVTAIAKDSAIPIRYFCQAHKGPAAARNVGIRNAAGGIILFLGDDIIASERLLEEHLTWHARYADMNVGVLGRITWSRDIKITPFMEWLEHGGPQFTFWKAEGKTEVDPEDFFFSSNISVKRSFLLSKDALFDESFPAAAYEDLDLGHRLKQEGFILKYNKDAVGYHDHYTSLEDACRRMVTVGESGEVLARKLARPPKGACASVIRKSLSRLKFIVYYLIGKLYEKRAVKDGVFGYLMEYCYLAGARRYHKKRGMA